jgi:hypothetical protein
VRTPDARGAQLVLARSLDGERLESVATLDKSRFGAESLERPALVRVEAGWRLYVSCATPGSKHWRIDVLEASRPEDLGVAEPRNVFPGGDDVGVKDPVIRRRGIGWEAWICCHPLDVHDEEDRITSAYATSDDGLAWTWHGTVLSGRRGKWDARAARVTAVLAAGVFSYDGRATKGENFSERTGLAVLHAGVLVPVNENPVADVRYLDVVAAPNGERRIFYEAPLPDGSHELRTDVIALRDRR